MYAVKNKVQIAVKVFVLVNVVFIINLIVRCAF